MTEERLSRRARRAQEETPHGDPAAEFAARVQAGEVPDVGPDGHVLSRRERRRLERVVHPVESWTAEEEMIATGQIPAVTPEVIAEQERLAREKAAQAQAEAVAASAEMRLVAAAEARPERLAEVTGQVQQVAEPVEVVAEPVQAVEQAPEVLPVLEAPSTDPSPVPASLRHLFPPGSLQARAFEEQEAKAAAAQAEPQPADDDDAAAEIRRLAAAAMANLERAAHEEQEPEPVEAAAPLSPFEEALAAAEAAVAAATPVDMGSHSAPVPVVATPDTVAPSAVLPDLASPATASPTGGIPSPFEAAGLGGIRGEALTEVMAVPTFEQDVPAVEPDPLPVVSEPIPVVSRLDPTPSGSVPSVPAASSPWEQHPLDAAPAAQVDVNAYTPVADLPTPDLAALQQAHANPFAPVGSSGQVAPNPFGQPPFTQAFGAAQPQQSALFPGQPLTGQTPIFPGALGGANPSTGAIPLVNGAVPTMPGQLLTGSVPTVNREARLQEAGGVRHYRWVHFVVLGALMFVFGVVMYQVIRVNT